MLLILHQACVCWAYCWCGISNMIAHQRKTWMFLMACFWNADFEAEEVKSLFFFLLVGCTALEGAAGEPLDVQQHSQNDSLKLPYVWKIALEMIWDCDHWSFFCLPSLWAVKLQLFPHPAVWPQNIAVVLSLSGKYGRNGGKSGLSLIVMNHRFLWTVTWRCCCCCLLRLNLELKLEAMRFSFFLLRDFFFSTIACVWWRDKAQLWRFGTIKQRSLGSIRWKLFLFGKTNNCFFFFSKCVLQCIGTASIKSCTDS